MTVVADPPATWVRLPGARPDSPLSQWRRLVSFDPTEHVPCGYVLRFADGTATPFHLDNLHLLELSDTDPRS